jgi:NAD(P)-dependent dehydrogenase (short-subunit alcohol dehydrogenase family)
MSADRLLEGRIAIVTGGGHGVGRGIALAFCEAGAKVVVCGRTAATLASVRGEIEGRGGEALDVVCDITRQGNLEHLVAATLDRFGGIDILVNNAALVPHGTLLGIDDQLIQGAWETGPLASLQLMRLCHPHLKKSGAGAIINISSGAATAAKVPDRGIYAAVKAALNAISRAAANEWGADGIRVNTIMPVARTEAVDKFFQNEPERAAAAFSAIPLGRVGDPENDIGPVAVFLAGPQSRYLTGITVTADGGLGFLR